jgi:hypothetical protein
VSDPINRPSHYTHGTIEPIDVIEDWGLSFHVANALKYIARHEHKGSAITDIDKAIWYLQRYRALLADAKFDAVAAEVRP